MKSVFDAISDAVVNDVDEKEQQSIIEENIIPISPVTEQTAEKTTIAFIDGGNAVLLDSPSISLQFIRVAAVLFHGRKNVKTIKHEFFVMAKSAVKDEKTVFTANCFSEEHKPFLDDVLSFDAGNTDSVQVGDIVRRLAELHLAVEVSKELKKGDITVIDGTFDVTNQYEQKYINILNSTVQQNGVLFAGLAKASRLLTKTGDSLATSLLQKILKQTWFYDSDSAVFAKLHRRAKNVFRVDALPSVNMGYIMPLLAFHSADPAFPGYPYGLIKADSLARVSNNETELLKTRLIAKLESLHGQKAEAYLNALNAHSILDKLSY